MDEKSKVKSTQNAVFNFNGLIGFLTFVLEKFLDMRLAPALNIPMPINCVQVF